MTIKYHIHQPAEYSAGILGFTDDIEIKIESGDPGGEDGEFAQFMLDALKDWYDGASVSIERKEGET